MKLYNTPKKAVEEVKPQTEQVTVYTCGPTVYDYPHIGNWFTFIRYDLLVRALKLEGLNPKWVMNITDVGHLVSDADEGEDKLEKGAKREGKTAWEVAEFYTQNFLEGMKALNISQPDVMPKATDHIQEQLDLVKKLEEKGFTYVIDDGVYFDTSKFPTYADFAHLNLAAQEEGARVEANLQKKNPSDFALWKFSPKDQTRDMEWDSPWGKGFPGWHLECSAMSMKYLGETIDIHAGGIDHIPVHHTNEIAQSEAATGKPFVNYWMHTNHILVDDQKISKSLGNGITLEDIVTKGFSPLALRLLVMESSYRTQSTFSWEVLEAAQNRLNNLYAWADLRHQPSAPAMTDELDNLFKETRENMRAALANNLDTVSALAHLNKLVNYMQNIAIPGVDGKYTDGTLAELDLMLGLNLDKRSDITDEQKSLLADRQTARDAGDWAQSDSIRDQLATMRLGVRDTAHGQVWYRF